MKFLIIAVLSVSLISCSKKAETDAGDAVVSDVQVSADTVDAAADATPVDAAADISPAVDVTDTDG